MRMKRILSAVMAAALSLALVLPAGAVSSSYGDISDQNTAVNADILRLMGVANGVGGNNFNPGGTLTRAEFATMAVKFMQQGDKAPLYETRTIFPDVTVKHWSHAFVNLAASTTIKDGEKDIHLIAGKGDGKFHPDDKITMAETVTILLRVLGYSSKETGTVWPQSFMNLGKSIGLTDGVAAGPLQTINRAQTAQLFVNALRCKGSDGKHGYEALGTVAENTIILAVGVQTDDGSSDCAIRTTANENAESYQAVGGKVKPTALQGKRGALVLNDKQQIVTFVPDDSEAIQVVLSGNPTPSYIKATNGKQYVMGKDTMLYTADAKEGQKYQEGYSALKPGSQLTLYAERGKIAVVYAAGSTAGSSSDAVVVQGQPSVAMFHQLTNGASDFKIMKNRQFISMSQLKPWDVVTYDSMSNTLIASDLRLTCIYESGDPSVQAPLTISVLGQKFDVLESAWPSIQNFRLNQRVTLLLTADGKVAGMAEPAAQAQSNAIGLVTDTGVKMYLPDGGEKELTGTVADKAELQNEIVMLSSSDKGHINTSGLMRRGADGDFKVKDMKLGSYTVAAGVRIFERVVGGGVVPVELGTLNMESIPGNKISSLHLNSSNMVDYLVLEAVTGDAYTYGILIEGTQSGGSGDMSFDNRTGRVENGTGGLPELLCAHSFRNKAFGGIARSTDSTKAASAVELKAVSGVKPADFFESEGNTYVRAGGKVYQVAQNVECYQSDSRSWFTQESGTARLAACKLYSSNLTIHLDPIAEKVRVVSAG